MDVLTNAKMRQVDEDTIERFYPGLELMERAGRHVAEFILKRYPAEGFKASIFVGPGNNGGDALVVARYLSEHGRAVSLHYLAAVEAFSIDTAKNYQRLEPLLKSQRNLKEINSTRPDWLNILRKDLVDSTLIIDGLFGTGLSRGIDGRAKDIVEAINRSPVPVLSLDTPSGIHGDTGEVLGAAVQAEMTITMGYPKLGMLFFPGKSYVGELRVADLGFPDEVLQVHSLGVHFLDRREAASRLPLRPPDTHKFDCGSVLMLSGSRAFTGAAALAAEAVLRSGCGVVYVAVPESVRPIVEGSLREAMTVPVPETVDGTISKESLSIIAPYLDKVDALVIGPGLGASDETSRFLQDVIRKSRVPVVLDADGINAFAGHHDALRDLPSRLIVTPHSGELKRLTGSEVPTGAIERVDFTRHFAQATGITVVHKGAPTLVASHDGHVWVNAHGNSALATAGTGDVLAGLVGGLLAQGCNALDSALVACVIHGRAGELASKIHGVRGVIAGDVLKQTGAAMLELEAMAGSSLQ